MVQCTVGLVACVGLVVAREVNGCCAETNQHCVHYNAGGAGQAKCDIKGVFFGMCTGVHI